MSTTTGSPGWMTRPVAVWWGLAALGPEATTAKQNSSWVSRIACSMSRERSRSVRPAQRSPARPSTT